MPEKGVCVSEDACDLQPPLTQITPSPEHRAAAEFAQWTKK